MTKRVGPITLDGEAADRITLLNLKEYRNYLKQELAEWRKNPRTDDNPTGYWLHPEDVVGHSAVVNALNLIIKQFGG
jgi:hypothetical protein